MAWSRVPIAAAADARLGTACLRVLIALGRYVNAEGVAFPSLATLSSVTGLARTNVCRAINQLEQAGYIKRARRMDKAGDPTSTEYRLIFAADEAVTTEALGSDPAVTTGSDQPVTLTTHPSKQPIGTAQPELPKLVLADASKRDEAFEEFYQIYPRKIERRRAEKAWKKATKTTSPALINDGARRYALHRQNKDQEFTKYPSTWLNDHGWLEEGEPKNEHINGAGASQRSKTAVSVDERRRRLAEAAQTRLPDTERQ